MDKLFYIVERHIGLDRKESDIAHIGTVGGKLYRSYEAAKQVIINELVPHSEDCKGSNHYRTEYIKTTFGPYNEPEEMWKITTRDKNDHDTVYFVKEVEVAPD